MTFEKGQKLWIRHAWRDEWQEVRFVRLTAGDVYAVVETNEYGPWGTRHALVEDLHTEAPDGER